MYGFDVLAAVRDERLADRARSFGWLESAADLLREPDPGETPWLVERLIVDGALAAVVGPPKAAKTWILLEVAVAVVTGRPAFDVCPVPAPGPVVLVVEESGRAALYRRLDRLRRGRATEVEALDSLHFAANRRVRLDDPGWQDELRAVGRELHPRAFLLDPLVRMKGAERDESSQRDMGPVVEYLRDLRDDSQAAVVWVHHKGHSGEHMRGTSDLESVWESRVDVSREGNEVELRAEHREAESGGVVPVRMRWASETRSLRMTGEGERDLDLGELILAHLENFGPQRAEEIARGVGARDQDVRTWLARLEETGTAHVGPSGRTDERGRPIRDKVWSLSEGAEP